MIPRLALTVLYGVVTMYRCEDFSPVTRCGLRCTEVQNGIAVDIDALGWQCGDEIVIWSGGVRYDRIVTDSGPLSRYAVEWPGVGLLPIAGDSPKDDAWFPGLSARAVVVNASAARERMGMER